VSLTPLSSGLVIISDRHDGDHRRTCIESHGCDFQLRSLRASLWMSPKQKHFTRNVLDVAVLMLAIVGFAVLLWLLVDYFAGPEK
jgi:hypothetical protein